MVILGGWVFLMSEAPLYVAEGLGVGVWGRGSTSQENTRNTLSTQRRVQPTSYLRHIMAKLTSGFKAFPLKDVKSGCHEPSFVAPWQGARRGPSTRPSSLVSKLRALIPEP